MKLDHFGIWRVAILVFVAVALSGAARAQVNPPTRQTPETAVRPGDRQVSNGEKAKVKGIIIRREADSFSVADDATSNETVVVLTERTSVKSKGGFLRSGKDYGVTNLLRGLRVEVEGYGNQNGQLVAEKIRFDSGDLRTAKVIESRVAPVEEANRHLSGQVAEANELSKSARAEAGAAHERISALDDYIVKDSITVLFSVNSTAISPGDRAALDQLASKATTTKGYVIEVAGYTDATGSVARNRLLSQQRADAVVRYLQENHDIPLRRMVTPFGYGKMKPVADNSSSEGRRQNRRVEVKILVNNGITRSPSTSGSPSS